jgi:biotin-dependent carboxylase-like uncharacterized protein
MITVERTAPLLTVQDRGRPGLLASGVTHSGPLDALALDVANALVGNRDDAAALEGCLGGATFRLDAATTFAVTGATVVATLNGTAIDTYVAHHAGAGDTFAIERLERGAIWYFAVRGGVDVPLVLGSRSTHVAAGLGGLDGGAIKTGRQIAVARPEARAAMRGAMRGATPAALRASLDDAPIELCPAPRAEALTGDEWETFCRDTYTVSHAVSRTGYRLQGPVIPSRLSADLPSEPACAGAMQLPPEGQPIVLMADHPTIGGYPIIGVVPAHALGRLAQRAPGMHVQFTRMAAEDALAARREQRNALSKWVARG